MWYTKYIEKYIDGAGSFLGRLFHAHEVSESRWLTLVFYALIIHHVLVFGAWRSAGILTKSLVNEGSLLCWPYALSCEKFHVFLDMPFGYSLGILYAVLGGILVLGVYTALKNRWEYALGLLFLVTIFKFFVVYIASYNVPTNYNALALFVSLLLLFSRDKAFSLKVFVTLFYYITVLYRIHPGYFTGDVFRSLSLGLPLIPDSLLPITGILFVCVLILAPTILWSSKTVLRLIGLVTLGSFHILTIALVGYVYPLLSLPLLIFAYHTRARFTFLRFVASPLLLFLSLIMLLGQLIPLSIPGDHRITGEGTKFGFYMFEANHQCSGYLEQLTRAGTTSLTPYSIGSGMGVCDPYVLWFKARVFCENADTLRVRGYFMHSINGKPYHLVVDEPNICTQDYTIFTHNDWIRDDSMLPIRPPKNSLLPNAL